MWNQTWTDRLKQDLFVKYDKFARPTQHFNTTMVKFGITLLYVDVVSIRNIKMYNHSCDSINGFFSIFRMTSNLPSPSMDGLLMYVKLSHNTLNILI